MATGAGAGDQMIWDIVLVFALGFVVDLIYVKWAISATSKKVLDAAIWACYIQVLGITSIKLALTDDAYLIANAIGHALGTAAGVLQSKRAKPRE